MKRILSTLTLLLCFAFTAVNAQVITVERAAEIANSFFSAGVQKSAAARGVVSSPSLTSSFDSNDVAETASAEPTFYVLTNPEGGFVIVSGEETENPIIGYSLDGTIDVNNLPDGFVDYMTDIDAQVKALREYNANNPQKVAARSAMQKAASFDYNANTMGEIVKNLNTAPWGQSAPFNNLCKTENGQTALTGCGPTAFAILCYYYKWPASGVGTVTHQGTGENMELGHTYDYASMRNDNYQSGYEEDEANAVAVLMRDLGWANQVAYGTSATSFGETAQHMVDHFRFKSVRPVDHGASLAVVRSTLGNDTQWKTYIKNNLNAGYPIPYASTTNSSNSARHIYILDGYTDNDYYHFNWGWSGQGNGWFTLDNMVPDNTSNYSNSHKAYYIIPDATTYTVTATVNDSNMGTVSINAGTAGSTASADLMQGVTATLTAHPAQGYALASWTKNGVVVGSRNTIEVTVGTDANDYVANFDDEANVTVIQDYIINATSGTELTTNKVKEWAFNRDNDYPAELKLTSTAKSINTNNAGDCIQLYLQSGTSETYTLSVQEDYEITKYTIRCKTPSSTHITSIAAEGQIYTPTTAYADYTFTKNTLARSSANTSAITITGSQNRALQVESITVTVAKEGAGGGAIPTPTQYTITATANPGTAGSVTGGGTYDEGATVTLTATPNSGYEFVNWTKGGEEVSTDATYSFTADANASYVANFQATAQTTFAVTTTANPAAGGTATFAVGTGQETTSATIASGTQVTLYAVANDGYRFVNWTKGGIEVSTNATTPNVTITEVSNYVANFEEEESQDVLTTGYYHLVSRATSSHEYLYNNALRTNNSKEFTLQSDSKITTNNGIWYITVNGNQLGVKNGDGNALVTGAAYCGNATSHNTLNIQKTTDVDDVTYYSFVEGINCTNRDQYNFTLEGSNPVKASDNNYVTTWTGHPDDQANQWRLERVDTDGKNIYDVVVECTEQDVYVVYGSGTNEEYAFNGGFFITDATITAQLLTAKKGNDAAQDVTISVEGNTIRVVDTESFDITVSTTPAEGGSVTGGGTYNEGATVTLTATPAEGYHFVNWTNNLNTDIVTENPYTPTAAADVTYTANFAKNSYELTYIVEGVETTHNVEYGASLPAAPATEKTGYTFTSWDKEVPATMPAEDVTLTAQFTINSYKLTYIVDDVETTHNVEYGASLPAAPATEKTGYTFTGWDKEVPATMPAEDVTLTAQFQQNVVTPTYYNVSVNPADTNGSVNAEYIGTGKKVEAGTEVTFTATPNGGYEFDGWYNGETLVTKVNPYTFTVNSDINYTARFNEEAGETPTTYAIRIETVDANGNPLVNNATGEVQALINNVGMEWCTAYEFDANTNVVLVATSDHNESAYLFDGWYKNDVLVSKDLEITFKATEAATYQARFSQGRIVTLASSSKTWGYPNIITYENGDPVVGTATKLRAVVRDGERLLISINPNYGYRVVNWTDKSGNEVAGKNANSFILTVNGDNNYTANLERVTYTLTVIANNEGGTVSATSEISTGTNIQVGHNMEATITATAKPGYRFVNWTKGTNVVSESATYTIPGIADVEDMLDAEYEAVFEEVEAGTYYRIAYDFEVPAQSVATRAAGDVQTYVVSTSTGSFSADTIWTSTVNNNPAGLKMLATNDNGKTIASMDPTSANQYNNFSLKAGGTLGFTDYYSTTYTLSVAPGFKITGYEMTYYPSTGGKVTLTTDFGYTETPESSSNDYVVRSSEYEFTESEETKFVVSTSAGKLGYSIRIVNFEVYVQEVGGGETPEPDTETVRYYVQSEACGVSEKENALKMTPQETGAASIFYYADNKLMSYATGTYVNENGNTRGLQDVGVAGGDVTFESNKIKFTNGLNVAYMHAVINQSGTSYVDHCGSNNGDPQHNFIIEEVTSLPVTISDAGYATWYAPVAVQLPDGLTAYTITIQGDYAITGEGFKQVPANTGVILEGAEGTYELQIIDSASEVESIMEGTVAAEILPNGSAYVLSTNKGTRELGFYMANDGQASWSHKAYLPKSAIPADAQMSAGFRLILPGTTAVENVEMRNEKEEIYDLTGRKLEGISGTGIYIINGKKVIVR